MHTDACLLTNLQKEPFKCPHVGCMGSIFSVLPHQNYGCVSGMTVAASFENKTRMPHDPCQIKLAAPMVHEIYALCCILEPPQSIVMLESPYTAHTRYMIRSARSIGDGRLPQIELSINHKLLF
jgi:hypothetical protein